MWRFSERTKERFFCGSPAQMVETDIFPRTVYVDNKVDARRHDSQPVKAGEQIKQRRSLFVKNRFRKK